MLRMANNYYEDDSLERAYVLYHKYLSLFIEKLPKHPQYATVDARDKAKVKKALMVVLKKCEDIKAALKLIFREQYEEYLEQVEVEKRKEEELARRMEQLKLQEEDQRAKQETEKWVLVQYHH